MNIESSDIATVVALSQQIPELDNPYPAEEYYQRLKDVPHLILVAFDKGKPIGFKVGYERTGYFYSWMGGVHPDFRRAGVALALAQAQEKWAVAQGYSSVTFKTRNRLKGMLCFALQRGFNIINVDPYEQIEESRVWLRKEL